jgi:HTH-type transcriptional regulator/antitoxin HigA
VSLHLEANREQAFIDDLDASCKNTQEQQANKFAAEALVPKGKWNRSGLISNWSAGAVVDFAKRLRIHPAIVGGRIRRERDNHKILWQLLGKDEVRRHFESQ